VLNIVDPVTLVFLAIRVRKKAFSVSFIINEISFESVAISMIKYTEPVGLAILPVTSILRAIIPNLNAMAMFEVH